MNQRMPSEKFSRAFDDEYRRAFLDFGSYVRPGEIQVVKNEPRITPELSTLTRLIDDVHEKINELNVAIGVLQDWIRRYECSD